MAFQNVWNERKNKADEMPSYVMSEASNAYKANSALSVLYASDYTYDEWKNIGISFKAAGGELSDWLAWCSIDASRYDERTARKLYDSVSEDGAITANTLWKLAWNAGWDWHERFTALPKVKRIPEAREFDSDDEQAITQLCAMFQPDA